LTGHTSFVKTVDFSPDGTYLASGGGDRKIKVWDLTGHDIATFEGWILQYFVL